MLRLLLVHTILSTAVAAQLLVPRQENGGTGSSYLNSVCLPAVPAGQEIPPCISISTIETQCLPNGTSTLDYSASAQCLCNAPSTFFADWIGCRECLFYHGGLSQQDFNRATSVLAIVSSTMCGANAAPTAEFAAIYSNVNVAFTNVVSGATVSSDQAVSSTAVSLYYTAAGTQGPGVITGSAAQATATGGTTAKTAGTATGTSAQTLTGKSSSGTGTKTGIGNGATSTSSSEMRGTAVPAMAAVALMIAGGAAALM